VNSVIIDRRYIGTAGDPGASPPLSARLLDATGYRRDEKAVARIT